MTVVVAVSIHSSSISTSQATVSLVRSAGDTMPLWQRCLGTVSHGSKAY